MSAFVVIKTFLHRHTAEMAKGLLDEQKIQCMLQGDDCAGLEAGMSFGSTLKLLVLKKDIEKVKKVLAVLED